MTKKDLATCEFANCDRPAFSRQLCVGHYKRYWRERRGESAPRLSAPLGTKEGGLVRLQLRMDEGVSGLLQKAAKKSGVKKTALARAALEDWQKSSRDGTRLPAKFVETLVRGLVERTRGSYSSTPWALEVKPETAEALKTAASAARSRRDVPVAEDITVSAVARAVLELFVQRP